MLLLYSIYNNAHKQIRWIRVELKSFKLAITFHMLKWMTRRFVMYFRVRMFTYSRRIFELHWSYTWTRSTNLYICPQMANTLNHPFICHLRSRQLFSSYNALPTLIPNIVSGSAAPPFPMFSFCCLYASIVFLNSSKSPRDISRSNISTSIWSAAVCGKRNWMQPNWNKVELQWNR